MYGLKAREHARLRDQSQTGSLSMPSVTGLVLAGAEAPVTAETGGGLRHRGASHARDQRGLSPSPSRSPRPAPHPRPRDALASGLRPLRPRLQPSGPGRAPALPSAAATARPAPPCLREGGGRSPAAVPQGGAGTGSSASGRAAAGTTRRARADSQPRGTRRRGPPPPTPWGPPPRPRSSPRSRAPRSAPRSGSVPISPITTSSACLRGSRRRRPPGSQGAAVSIATGPAVVSMATPAAAAAARGDWRAALKEPWAPPRLAELARGPALLRRGGRGPRAPPPSSPSARRGAGSRAPSRPRRLRRRRARGGAGRASAPRGPGSLPAGAVPAGGCAGLPRPACRPHAGPKPARPQARSRAPSLTGRRPPVGSCRRWESGALRPRLGTAALPSSGAAGRAVQLPSAGAESRAPGSRPPKQ